MGAAAGLWTASPWPVQIDRFGELGNRPWNSYVSRCSARCSNHAEASSYVASTHFHHGSAWPRYENAVPLTGQSSGWALRQLQTLDSGTDSRVHTDIVSANSLRSGELARLTGVSADTVRHYERLGILPKPQRTNGGYRIFPASAVERVQLAQRALQLGFSLNELAEILRNRDNGGVPCHRVLDLTEAKLQLLGERIEELQQTQEYMRKLVRDWRKKLKHTPPGSKAMLLHSLVDKPKTKSEQDNLERRSRS